MNISLPKTKLLSIPNTQNAFFNFVRGKPTNGQRGVSLLEKQHGGLFFPPPKSLALGYCTRDLMKMCSQTPADYRIAMAIIGHTWSFAKSCEFVSRSQFINGKYDAEDNLLVAGGGSDGSITPATGRLKEQGIVRRAVLAAPSGISITMYAPNIFAGDYPFKSNYFHLNILEDQSTLTTSTLSPQSATIINALRTPIHPDYQEYDTNGFYGYREYPFLLDLLVRLKHPDILPVLIERKGATFQAIIENRKGYEQTLDELARKNKANTKVKISTPYPEHFEMVESKVNLYEREQLSLLEEDIRHLQAVRANLDSQDWSISLSVAERKTQLDLLIARWGHTLLSLSLDAWSQFEKLAQKKQDTYYSLYLELGEVRNSLPWIKKSQLHYDKAKSKSKGNSKPSKSKAQLQVVHG